MNIGRQTLLILLCCLFSGAGPVLSQTRLPDSAFEDWTALVTETALPDGSVLFNYIARTLSSRTEGAMLAISFVPRFSCAPSVTLRKRTGPELASETAILEITVDSERMQYDALIDEVDEYRTYALAASSDMQDQLRQKMDVASRLTFKVLLSDTAAVASSNELSATDALNSIVFSLRGSKLATLSAENHCRAHKPLEFNSQ